MLVPKKWAMGQATCRVGPWHKLLEPLFSDSSQRRVSSQKEGAQLGGDLRTAVLLKEIFVFLRKLGALQAGLVRCHWGWRPDNHMAGPE